MILQYGDIDLLNREVKKWYLLELSSDKTMQGILKRVGKQIPSIFRSDPVEVFLPVSARDLNVFDIKTGNYVFCRSTNFPALLRLKTVTGVVGLVTEGDSSRPSKAIAVEDSYVQEIISEIEKEFHNRAVGIEVGSFVRILDGETKDYCGFVVAVDGGSAIVNIDLKTKQILVDTPLRNMLNLAAVPEELRTFYYGPLIEELYRDELNNLIIAEDLLYKEELAMAEECEEVQETLEKEIHHSRQRTVTALVKKLMGEGSLEPLLIAKNVLISIKKNEVKAPKNIFIIYGIIKNSLKDYYASVDPTINNYREVIRKYGRQFKFTPEDIVALDPNSEIPTYTSEVCLDGRSREARLRKKDA